MTPKALKLFIFVLVLVVELSLFQLGKVGTFVSSGDLVRSIFSHLALVLGLSCIMLFLSKKVANVAFSLMGPIVFLQSFALAFYGQNISLSLLPESPMALINFKYYMLHLSWIYLIYVVTALAVALMVSNYFWNMFKVIRYYKFEVACVVSLVLVLDLLIPLSPKSFPQKNLNFITYNIFQFSLNGPYKKERIELSLSPPAKLRRSLVVINLEGFTHDQKYVNVMDNLNKLRIKEKAVSSAIIGNLKEYIWGVHSLCPDSAFCPTKSLSGGGKELYFLSAFPLEKDIENQIESFGFKNFVYPSYDKEQLVSSTPKLSGNEDVFKISLGLLKSLENPSLIYFDYYSLLPPFITKNEKGSHAKSYLHLDHLLKLYFQQIEENGLKDKVDILLFSTNPKPLILKLHPLGPYLGHFTFFSTQTRFKNYKFEDFISKKSFTEFISLILSDPEETLKKNGDEREEFLIDDPIGLKTVVINEEEITLCSKLWNSCEKISLKNKRL